MIKSRITVQTAIEIVQLSITRPFTIRQGSAHGFVTLTVDEKDDGYFEGIAASIGQELIWLKSDEMPQAHWIKQLMEHKADLAAREEKIKIMGADLEGLKNDLANVKDKGKKPPKKTVKFPPAKNK